MSTEFVKVTVLAFVYVPLNLATSIFGMNIQQLNGSGQKLWVFFTTAVAALLITGGSWLIPNLKAVVWYRKRAAAKKADDEKWNGEEYGLLLRMTLLVWLLRGGFKTWMWESGAWAAILTNSKTECYSLVYSDHLTACNYVSRYSSADVAENFSTRSPDLEIAWSTPLR